MYKSVIQGNNAYKTFSYARIFVLVLLLLGGLIPQRVVAQGYFTLTNGRLWWSNGMENQPDDDWKDPVAFDASRGWSEVHPHGTEHVTHITAQGDTYLALDISDPTQPRIISKPHSAFDLYCVWYRTGYTGYYYQEWFNDADQKTYRYYIVGSHDEGLEVVRSEVGQPLEKSSYWYNWDFGAAVWEKPTINGASADRYYWIMFQERNRVDGNTLDNADKVWTLSENSYQRPEDIYYTVYEEGDDIANAQHRRYYDGVFDGVDAYNPVGNGALFMPVTVTAHEKEIRSIELDHSDSDKPYGLQKTVNAENVTLGTGIELGTSELDYDPAGTASTTLTAVMKYKNGDKVPMTVLPAYTEYNEETYRRGIHLNYVERTQEVFGSAGVGTYRNHIFYGGSEHSSIPTEVSENASVDTIIFSVDNRSRRYVEVSPIAPMSTHPTGTTLRFHSPVDGTHTVHVYVTVRYNNGAEQSDTTSLVLRYEKPSRTPDPGKGPVVRGAVYGGGRMANVGGGTKVIVHSTDSIQTLYGGNDIAGWVQGDEGANLQIGTAFTDADHPVHIGNVYGGGNGYYTYQGINAGYNEALDQHMNPYFWKKTTALGYQAYYFNGKVYPWNTLPSGYMVSAEEADRINKDTTEWEDLTPVVEHKFNYTPFYIGRPDLVDQAETGDDGDGTIPYIKTAHITVGVPESTRGSMTDANGHSTHHHNDYIVVDTLFGGARNAFIGVTANENENPENGVTIDINGGTLYSVFGGNNVGGSVANTSTVFVNVNDTKLLPADKDYNNSIITGYGHDFGIRYLFGGGNLVDGSHASVNIYGGMIDTAFLGGNNATVMNPIGTVECRRTGTLNEYGYDGHFICTNTTYPDNSTFTNPYEALDTNEHFFDNYGPDNFAPEEGKYNINCLFGGNNAADMSNLTTLMLHSGGISTVYGGGNLGDMTNDTLYTVAGSGPGTGANQLFPQALYNQLFLQAYDINPDGSLIDGGWAKTYGRSTLPNKVGTLVTALPDSKIVCDYVFGGSRMANVKNSCGVYLAGGVYGYVNGGNDVSGDVGSETGGGTYLVLDQNVLVVGDAIAGSDGYYHCDDGTGHYDGGALYDTYSDEDNALSYDPYDDYVGMLFPTHNNVNLYMRGGLVLGQLIGGGVHADVGFPQRQNYIKKLDTDPNSSTYGQRVETEIDLTTVGGANRGTVHFMAKGGRVVNNAFGGGFQSNINGLAYLTLRGNTKIDGAFFSGNDCTGSIRSFGAYLNTNDYEDNIAAGMSEADALAAAYQKMEASDGTKLNSNSGSWNADVSAYLRVEDTPEIGSIYGSGNGAYNYDGTRSQYESVSFCSDPTGNITPKQSSTFIDIHTSGGTINTVFGGGNGVGVEDKVVVLLNNTNDAVHSVHTIFGGNNVDDMWDVVPDIRLAQGIVNTVFGGANNGVMGAKKNFTDILGNVVSNVSTHVVLESPHVTVLDTIFGGNRMSDIEGTSYVEVKNTKDAGVNYVFGGNDISGNITGIARIDVSGGTVHNLFGGSDGRYDFIEIGDNLYNIYPFGTVASGDTAGKLITTAGRPDVDSTSLNLWGGAVGTADGGIYGGGSMAQSRATSVVVNDTVAGGDRNLTISGAIFGGGMGDWEHLNNRDLHGNRYGNITEATHVELHHADLVTSAKAYGGGRGGDVMNTYITVYDGWEQQFDYLYGGCWGSDVFGTTHVTMNGKNMGVDNYNVKGLFGGNDFSGDVYKSDITVNSGHYKNIYGAGNGDYPSGNYTTTLRRPNNEYVNLTFNDGEVDSNLYGGGKLGTTFAYKKDASHQYIIEGGQKVPDTTLSYMASHSDPEDYSYIIANIHGGVFHNNIFTGARGSRVDKTPLVYGLKVLNMDGGRVDESVYGGSESVNDGYPRECVNSTASTMRPSSILNITGGMIEGNLYGAGYLGLTHGSVYVNIGSDAIDSCVAYSKSYKYGDVGSASGAYRKFKPGETGSLSPALSNNDLLFNHSIYVGSNWGSAHGTADFTTPGFYGGESKIRIDGLNYNTDNDELNVLPQMNIVKSVFCSGTSVNGGDVVNSKEIDIWNYGSMVNCYPSKKLESVQRGDRLLFHNSVVELTGATDATSAYYSNPYSVNNITSLDFRGYNVIEFDASVDNVPEVNFYEEALLADGSLDLVPIQHLRQHTSSTACADTATTCSSLEVIDPEISDMQHTLLVLNNGIDFQIKQSSSTVAPGMVSGFGYVTVPQGYSSTILATATAGYGMSWITPGYFDWNSGVAGFASPCDTTNKYTEDRGLVDWRNFTNNTERLSSEIPYTNYSNPSTYGDYRVWEVGTGTRLRETTILAHTDPTHLNQDVSIFTHGNDKMAIAEASVKLPATSTGHYYKVISGINLVGENETVNLIDSAFLPAQNFANLDALYGTHGTVDVNPPVYGEFLGTTLALGGVALGVNEIIEHPTSTFGLVMAPGKYFEGHDNEYYRPSEAAYIMPAPDDPSASPLSPEQSLFVISGNSHVTSIQDYCSPIVTTGTALTPIMNFYLTYNTNFTSSFLGTVNFILMEYDENGNEVAPIEIKVYISTIIEEFKPVSTNVLAMYNAGRSNTFSRKVVLPATLEEDRQLYIKSLKWVPTDCNGNDSLQSNKFYLVGDESTIIGAPANNRNRFAINIIPSDNLSSDVASAIGWSHINMPDINLFKLKSPAHTAPSRYSDSTGWQTPKTIDFSNNDESDGLLIGTLDGRGSAVLNVQLTFDGTRRYPEIKGLGYIGKIELMLRSRLNGNTQEFPLTIYVKTREHGDTIYVASAPMVTRGGQTVRPYEDNPTYQYWTRSDASTVEKEAAAKMVGKSPNCYVRTFQEALSTKVYQEGDVICVLDTVKIEQGLGIAIHGGDGPAVEVIRYDAHHHEMANESGVYRGPMIQVSRSGSKFTATNIAFHGGAGAVIRKGTPLGPQQPDTNCAFGPIIQVMDRGGVTLSNGTTVQYNWNAYGSISNQLAVGGQPRNPSMMGAISVTSGGTLTLQNNVAIAYNLSHTFDGDNPAITSYDALRPFNGAVYVDGGRVVLPQSNAATAVNVTHNWLVDPAIHTSGNTVKWWKNKEINGTVVRYEFDETKVTDWQPANLLLARKASSTGDADLDDAQSDVISINGFLASATRIGVRKWFPGPTVRDTIRFAVCGGSNLTVLSQAVQNNNFLSDDDQQVFYSAKVNNNAIFLIRCATFRHQMQGVNLPLAGYQGKDVLQYGILASNSCPSGGDSIVYNIQGGFAPYTYTWTLKGTGGAADRVIREYTSPFANTQVQNGLNHGVEDYFWASISDTLLTPPVDMQDETFRQADVHVAAVDATGVCSLSKDLTIRLHRVAEITDIPGDHSKWQPVTDPNGWADTASYVVSNRKAAVGDRYYKAIKITPVIYADPSVGRIIATVNGEYQLYQYIDDENRNDLLTILFCEGDVIRLKTQANLEGYTFLMWNFAPFNENPATYVVPSHDDEVIAYYGSNRYWTEVINTPEKGGVAVSEQYSYTTRPDNVPTYQLYSGTSTTDTKKAGYVTTYNGDVHIYNENGLAWFISVVNGLNGEQVRPFQFNAVYLHKKDALNTPYDMRQFLWTPIGTRQYGFRGLLMGVSEVEGSTTPLTGDDRVIISNIVLNEPDMNYVGFFGLLQSASCTGIELQDILVRGGQYVGGFAAQSNQSAVDNCAVVGSSDSRLPIISTNYVSGGIVGDALQSEIKNSVSAAKYTGNAVHSGGITGKGVVNNITNNSSYVKDYMSGLYVGGITGTESGEEVQDDCRPTNLRASIMGIREDTSSVGADNLVYKVSVTWQSSDDDVTVAYCAGESWYETADNPVAWIEVDGNSVVLNIPVSYDTSIHGYTIAVKADCSESATNMSTTYVSCEDFVPCPEYWLESEVVTTDEGLYILHVNWGGEFYDESQANETLTLGYCIGTAWNADAAVTTQVNAFDGMQIGHDFTLSTPIATSYMVGLYSPCSDEWFSGRAVITPYDTTISPVGYNRHLADNNNRRHAHGRKRSDGRSLIANNYVHIAGNSQAQRIGGIVGRATNTDIMNNYVYGSVGGSETGGSVTAVMEQGTRAEDNFSAHGTATKNVGRQMGGMLSNTSGFEGQGNRVILDRNILGVNNLTRALNRWVREQNANGGQFKTWRSDLESINNGYPIFGDPDMIPVEANTIMDGCEEVVLNGITYTRDTVVTTHVVDYIEMVDSTVTATIRLHYGTHTLVSDSVEYGDDYQGYGFYLGADELRMLDQTIGTEGRASIILHDTLTTAFGCDSIVSLTLTFTGSREDPPSVETEFSVNVYPNPTTSVVHVETKEMSHVEVYDNEGRRLQDYDANGSNKITIDMTTYVSGVYFVRVHTPEGVVIQKVIKER